MSGITDAYIFLYSGETARRSGKVAHKPDSQDGKENQESRVDALARETVKASAVLQSAEKALVSVKPPPVIKSSPEAEQRQQARRLNSEIYLSHFSGQEKKEDMGSYLKENYPELDTQCLIPVYKDALSQAAGKNEAEQDKIFFEAGEKAGRSALSRSDVPELDRRIAISQLAQEIYSCGETFFQFIVGLMQALCTDETVPESHSIDSFVEKGLISPEFVHEILVEGLRLTREAVMALPDYEFDKGENLKDYLKESYPELDMDSIFERMQSPEPFEACSRAARRSLRKPHDTTFSDGDRRTALLQLAKELDLQGHRLASRGLKHGVQNYQPKGK